MIRFAVQRGNVTEVQSDLLLLKHAQSFYGADRAVAARLVERGICTEADLRPAPGHFVVLETKGCIAPTMVLFLGTPPLRSFTYAEMQAFARRAIEKIADLRLGVGSITTTVHGSGYGLDGGEALQRLVRGFREGISDQPATAIERITFLTLEEREERILSGALKAMAVVDDAPSTVPPPVARAKRGAGPRQEPAPGRAADQSVSMQPLVPTEDPLPSKRRVFVAMPFSEEFQNVYEHGIYPAVRNCGLICERVDETHFTGDILGRIRAGIESADLVVADMTEARPNVYLEVGYAWGRNIPVIIVAKKGEKLHFDVSTHRCVFYGRFTQFAKDLEELIRGIDASPKK
jgi:hypothetical protein